MKNPQEFNDRYDNLVSECIEGIFMAMDEIGLNEEIEFETYGIDKPMVTYFDAIDDYQLQPQVIDSVRLISEKGNDDLIEIRSENGAGYICGGRCEGFRREDVFDLYRAIGEISQVCGN